MSDTPPPLPVADDEVLTGAKAMDESRLAPPHAPLFWRTLAFIVDASLIGLLGYLVTTRVLLPEYKPEELAVFNGWMDATEKHNLTLFNEAQRAAEAGDLHRYWSVIKSVLAQKDEVPAGALAVMSFTSSAMTIIYWLGFAGMEIATGGASLGKKIFRLRVARFPHCEKPGVIDSIVRSGWKAMIVGGSLNPLTLIFAIVDAHWPLFNPLRRSLHDLMCRTLVLDARFDPPEEAKPDEEEVED